MKSWASLPQLIKCSYFNLGGTIYILILEEPFKILILLEQFEGNQASSVAESDQLGESVNCLHPLLIPSPTHCFINLYHRPMGKYSFCYITIMITFYSSQYMAVIFKIPWLMTFSYLQTDCLTPCHHHVKAHANQLHPVWGKNTNNKRFVQGKNSHLYHLDQYCDWMTDLVFGLQR